VPLVAAFSRSESDRDSARGAWKNGKRDGPWAFYFRNGHLAAEGTYSDGLQVGPWRFFYADGARFTEGQFDQHGHCHGRWILLGRDGTVNADERSGLRCEERTLFENVAGLRLCDWNELDHSQRQELSGVFPSRESGWNGSGVYEGGVWRY
jgi:hypothetical protein